MISKPSRTSKDRELKRLLPRHKRILTLHLDGMKSTDIAKMFNLTTESVRLIVNSPIFQSELSRRQANLEAKEDEALTFGVVKAREIIDESSAKAAQTQADLLDSRDERVKSSAAKDILDRALGSGDKDLASTVVLEKGAVQLLQLTMKEVREDILEGIGLQEADLGA